MPDDTLTNEEVAERVAILRRFRALLEEQRSKFREYLTVLEKQQTVIETEDMDAMVRHTELEQSIVSQIFTIQKVIDPMEALWRDAHPRAEETDIPRLKTDLERLKTDVLAQNERNRELLKSRMNVIREQVNSLRNPYAKRSSVYASSAHVGTRIDIES